MKNRWKRQHCHGVITSYRFTKQNVAVYMILYNKNKPAKRLICRIKVWSLYHRLRNLPAYKKNCSFDLGSLEGMPVYVEMILYGRRVYVKKIAFDLAYYGLEGGKVID